MTNPPTPKLNPDNRAYQRFVALLDEHFDVANWHRTNDADGVPVLTTIKDLHSGDLFTLALIDSVEETATAVLLAIAQDGHLTAHGPFHGQQAAQHHAPQLALADPDLAYTRGCALHDPAKADLPATWTPVPNTILATLRPTPVTTTPAVLILLDHTAERLAVHGPFPTHATADQWHDTATPGTDRLVVPLHQAASPH